MMPRDLLIVLSRTMHPRKKKILVKFIWRMQQRWVFQQSCYKFRTVDNGMRSWEWVYLQERIERVGPCWLLKLRQMGDLKRMQLCNGADHFGNVRNRGIIKHGCSLWGCRRTCTLLYISEMSQNCECFNIEGRRVARQTLKYLFGTS
jgi:hypothetical protein